MGQIMNKGQSQAKDLGAEALAAVAVLVRLGEADRRKAVQALGYAEVRRIWTPRDLGALPTLTALVAERDREAIYAAPAWATTYKRTTTMVVYILQAPGLAVLSSQLGGVSLAKVGSTALGNLPRRIDDLGAREYGAWTRGSKRYEHARGFDKFEPAPRLQLVAQHPASPIRLCGAGIEVDLPVGMSPEEFEATLNRKLLPIRLQTIADGTAGRELCDRTGVDPRELARFYGRGTGFRAATEFAVIRPQADIGALGRTCADIVVDAVLKLDARRPVR